MFASSGSSYAKIIDILLKNGADVDVKDKYNNTALIYASKHQRYNIIRTLLKFRADSDIKNNEGKTFLDYIDDHTIKKEFIELSESVRTRYIKPAKR